MHMHGDNTHTPVRGLDIFLKRAKDNRTYLKILLHIFERKFIEMYGRVFGLINHKYFI